MGLFVLLSLLSLSDPVSHVTPRKLHCPIEASHAQKVLELGIWRDMAIWPIPFIAIIS
jgi:hypothetical protein